MNFVSSFEEKLAKLARGKRCNGVICGHIHTPADKKIGDFRYLNSGDWVESLSAIVEHFDGTMELVYFHDFVIDYPIKQDALSEEADEDDLDLKRIGVLASWRKK